MSNQDTFDGLEMIDEMNPLDINELGAISKKTSPYKSQNYSHINLSNQKHQVQENDYVLQMMQANANANNQGMGSQSNLGGTGPDHGIKVVKSERKNLKKRKRAIKVQEFNESEMTKMSQMSEEQK